MPSKDKERILWDSCVIIDFLQKDVAHDYRILEEYANLALSGDIELIVSTLAMAEVAKLDDVGQSVAETEETIRRFFRSSFILPRPADSRVCDLAREIVRSARVSGADAVHIATAALTGANIIHTRDEKLLKANEAVKTSSGHIITIERPKTRKTPDLFTTLE